MIYGEHKVNAEHVLAITIRRLCVRVTRITALRPIFILARISLSALVRYIMFLNFFHDCEKITKKEAVNWKLRQRENKDPLELLLPASFPVPITVESYFSGPRESTLGASMEQALCVCVCFKFLN